MASIHYGNFLQETEIKHAENKKLFPALNVATNCFLAGSFAVFVVCCLACGFEYALGSEDNPGVDARYAEAQKIVTSFTKQQKTMESIRSGNINVVEALDSLVKGQSDSISFKTVRIGKDIALTGHAVSISDISSFPSKVNLKNGVMLNVSNITHSENGFEFIASAKPKVPVKPKAPKPKSKANVQTKANTQANN